MSSISYGLAGSTRVGNLASRLMVGSAETGNSRVGSISG
jgi:hypothetical protein